MFIRTVPVSFTVLPGQQSVLERPRGKIWFWSGTRNIIFTTKPHRELAPRVMRWSWHCCLIYTTPNLRIFPTFYSQFSLWRADYRTVSLYIYFLFFFFRLRFVVKPEYHPLTLHELSVSLSTVLEINNILSHVWFLNLLDTGSHQQLQTAQWCTCSSRRATQYFAPSRHIQVEFVMRLQDISFLFCKYTWFVWGNLKEKEMNKFPLRKVIRNDTISELNTFLKWPFNQPNNFYNYKTFETKT